MNIRLLTTRRKIIIRHQNNLTSKNLAKDLKNMLEKNLQNIYIEMYEIKYIPLLRIRDNLSFNYHEFTKEEIVKILEICEKIARTYSKEVCIAVNEKEITILFTDIKT